MSTVEFFDYLYQHDTSRELAWDLLGALQRRAYARAVADSRTGTATS